MDNDIITMVPTLCASEKLNKEELIKQCNYLQDEVMKLSQHVHELKIKLQDMTQLSDVLSGHLWELVDAHEKNSQAQIKDHLEMLASTLRRNRGQKAKVH